MSREALLQIVLHFLGPNKQLQRLDLLARGNFLAHEFFKVVMQPESLIFSSHMGEFDSDVARVSLIKIGLEVLHGRALVRLSSDRWIPLEAARVFELGQAPMRGIKCVRKILPAGFKINNRVEGHLRCVFWVVEA